MEARRSLLAGSTPLLVGLLVVSIATNLMLILGLNARSLVRRVELMMVHPPMILPTDHVRGSTRAGVTVIEYADFQCPFCARFHESMLLVLKQGNVRWVYRHYPLDVHPSAEPAAEASECAAEQGRFWDYADSLFAQQVHLNDRALFQIAEEIGLDSATFYRCLSSNRPAARVAANEADAALKMVNATPTFYVNRRRVEGVVSYERLKQMIAHGDSAGSRVKVSPSGTGH